MEVVNWLSVFTIVGVVAFTVMLGFWSTRVVRTTSDFFVASRTVGPLLNAAAISGEYLSAASFLGVAGMVMKFGFDVLWYPVGYTAGYLFLLLFIAAPLRRFGAYTIPDFAEGRVNSGFFRKIAVGFVLIIGFFYMLPQMKGAGITLQAILGAPYWAGVVLVGAVITLNVVLGGMRGITFVQAFQFWLKIFALLVPVFILIIVFGNYGGHVSNESNNPDVPRFQENTSINLKAGTTLQLKASTNFTVETAGQVTPEGKATQTVEPNQVYTVTSGNLIIVTANKLNFDAGQPVPNTITGNQWSGPFGPLTNPGGDSNEISLLYTYSLIIAIVLGTAGLPHILVRFYTNKDGKSARHTTLFVLGMIGVFYLLPPVFGALGRAHSPELYALGTTDTVVLSLPGKVGWHWAGEILMSITAAGAYAAFMSTYSGLLISVAGALSHDIYGRTIRPTASTRSRKIAFRVAALITGSASIVLGLFVEKFDINMLVGWAFAIAASSFFPMLLLGTWWRGLTKSGVTAGVLLGGLSSSLSIIITMVLGFAGTSAWNGSETSSVGPLAITLLSQPAIWSVPLAFITMFVVSRLTRKQIPPNVNHIMLRLHAPEALGLRKEYIND